MKKVLASLIIIGAVSTACASESKLKLDVSEAETSKREVAKAGVQEVARPESLKGDSPAYKKHKQYNKFIDRHYNK